MDDVLLRGLWQDPSPEFAARLRASLRRREIAAPERRRWPLAKLAVSAAVAAGVAGVFYVPAVRASAQSFLALFRVVHFVGVPVDSRRMDTLKQLDLPRLVGEHVQIVQDAGPPAPMVSLDQAATAAGFTLQVPAWLPKGARIVEMAVAGEHVVRVTADATRLQQVMDALGIRDLRVPDGLDGQAVTIHVPPVAMVRYEHGSRHTRLFQARSPEVAVPDGVDLAALGEIGLRIFGLSREDARTFSRVIDWQTTLLVPLPPTARSFKEVDIAGSRGIAIQAQPPNASLTNIVLWSRGGRVFALMSVQGMSDVVQMANSVQ